MSSYAQRLDQIVSGPPFNPDQMRSALALIQDTDNQMWTYITNVDHTVPGSSTMPEIAAALAYHRQTLQLARNIYQGILNSLSVPAISPVAMPPQSEEELSERMRSLLGELE